ncbi:MAG: type I secretion protein, partial [Cyanobacteria bacterium P01_C01_bin.120]
FDLTTEDEGKVLILSEDGDSADADDNAGGGTVRAQFDGLANVDSIGLLDIEEADGLITFYGEDDSVITEIAIDALGDNSLQQVSLGVEAVSYLEVAFPGSGAITELAFSLGEEVASIADLA